MFRLIRTNKCCRALVFLYRNAATWHVWETWCGFTFLRRSDKQCMTKSKEVIRCGYGNVITDLHQPECSRYRERKNDCNVLENSTNHRHPVASRADWMEMALRWKARMEQSQHYEWTPQQVMDFVRRTWPFLFYINPKHIMRTMKQTLSTAQYWGEHPNNDPEAAEFNELMFGEEAQDELDDLICMNLILSLRLIAPSVSYA